MNFPRTAEGREPLGHEAADSYSRWVRTAMKTAENWPEAAVLFDSTMREPTDLLMDVVREAFAGGVTLAGAALLAGAGAFAGAATLAAAAVFTGGATFFFVDADPDAPVLAVLDLFTPP